MECSLIFRFVIAEQILLHLVLHSNTVFKRHQPNLFPVENARQPVKAVPQADN